MAKAKRSFGDGSVKFLEMTRFIRLKVFHQILAVIGIMSIFFAVQAYLSVRVIQTMQAATPQLLNQGAYALDEISNLRVELASLKDAYLERLTGHAADSEPLAEAFDKIFQRIKSLGSIEAKTRRTILEKLRTVQAVIAAAPAESGYDTLRQELLNVNLYLENSYTEIFGGTLARVNANDQFSGKAQRNSMIIMILSIVCSVLLGVLIANSIAGPLRRIAATARAIAGGDLTENIRTAGSPEIAGAVAGLNQAIDGLRRLVSGIHTQLGLLTGASKELRLASELTGRSAAEVARSMEELSHGAEEQALQIGQAVRTVDQLAATVQQVSQDADRIATASEKVAQAAQTGRQATVAIAREITGLYSSTEEVAEVIAILRNTAAAIGETITLIQGIAEQTTLLALNASIEAARAGEQGKGFGVVARETGKLADQSKQAAESITSLILQMQERTERAVEVIRIGLGRADQGRNLVVQTKATFEEIFAALNDNSLQIRAVAQSAQQMSASNQAVIQFINAIASFSEESLSSTEQVSATAEEQSASVQEVTALAESLDRIAAQLQGAVAAFVLEEKRAEKADA
ncbi:methyl-accepting chemotaxis protein [Hydrogenispora ethanolica]|uniref:Methyl-accepting chemotaxis protein n=1 Tax=Hydrogenispora ethanolica TaxID=1082276 RepID=A0A4V2QGB5_HYDET|nr:methyl-accepting chemotaxis protein [Hydrogenispora ethanolica]TCL75177.1 methyl-accepting chemotaxis protein [Hydrogenispora ethanolica]